MTRRTDAELLEPRFWAKVQKGSGCWEWVGGRSRGGYGAFKVAGKQDGAHRISWKIHRGEIPDGLSVLHRCDNRGCVNPDHLFLGSTSDNSVDMWQKGRHPGFFNNRKYKSKLTVEQVKAIYTRAWAGEGPVALAREYGVATQTISGIKRGDNWSDVTGHVRAGEKKHG